MTRPTKAPVERITGLEHYLPGQNAFTACVPRSVPVASNTPPKKAKTKLERHQRLIISSSSEENYRRVTEFKVGSYPNNFTTEPAKPSKSIAVAGKRFATA